MTKKWSLVIEIARCFNCDNCTRACHDECHDNEFLGVAAGRDGAVVKRADGIVIIVPEKARGQKRIVDACPYGAVHWNEERQLPQACPTRAMQVLHVEDDEMQRIVDDEQLEVLNPEFGTASRVYYRNLRRFRPVFIADCVEGALVTLESRGCIELRPCAGAQLPPGVRSAEAASIN
jgi:Fe-S-cluster-containing dehydrogenase component